MNIILISKLNFRRHALAAAAWTAFLVPALHGEIPGAPAGVSGAPGDSDCTSCHGGRPNSGSGRVSIDAGGSTYTPGRQVRLKVTIEDPNARRWGFQVSARPESDGQSMAGAFATADSNTQVLKQGMLEWITHTENGTRRGTAGPVTFEFDWTAPASDIGPIVLYAAANAANNNNTSSGDSIYTANLKITALAGQPRPSFTSAAVTDTWTQRPGLAPGAWVNIAGSDLAAQEAYWSPASGKPIDTKLGGVTVKLNDVAAAISFVSPTRVTILVPGAIPEGDVPIVIERDGAASDPVSIRNAAALPAIHSVPDPGANRFYASVTTATAGTTLGLLNGKGWLLGKPSVDSRATRGAFPGEEIDIYATGLGATAPEFPTDRVFSGSFAVANAPRVRFGQLSVDAVSANLVSPGIYLVRVKVPESLAAGDVTVVLDVNGITSADNVFLNIEKAP